MHEARDIMSGKVQATAHEIVDDMVAALNEWVARLGLRLVPTTQLGKDHKRTERRSLDMGRCPCKALRYEEFATHCRDHALTDNSIGFREGSIQPDWPLVHTIDSDRLIFTASRTGTHSGPLDEWIDL